MRFINYRFHFITFSTISLQDMISNLSNDSEQSGISGMVGDTIAQLNPLGTWLNQRHALSDVSFL